MLVLVLVWVRMPIWVHDQTSGWGVGNSAITAPEGCKGCVGLVWVWRWVWEWEWVSVSV